MQQNCYKGNLKYDLSAGVVVFLIALPLCLGIALASGAPLFSGMIAGIIGGLVVGAISNSHTSVSGPAAGLTAVVLVAIQQLGHYEAFLLAALLAGVFQLLLGIVRAGSIADYIPSNVVKGMLSGIGIIIILKQIPHALGYDQDAEGDEAFLQADGDNTFSAIWRTLTDYIHPGATLVALLALGIMILWNKPAVKRWVGLVPGALVAVAAGVGMNVLFSVFGTPWVIESAHLVHIPIAASPSDFFALFRAPDFSQWQNPQIFSIAVTICAVASIETLLCIEAIDKIDPLRRSTDANRELRAQGVGNIVSALIGGLPITSVIVRSSANLDAGARTKLAAIAHGALLLICMLVIPGLLNLIPLASLAAVLMLVGYKLAKISIFKEMWANGKYQWRPFIVTVLAVVFTDLLSGVLIGLAVSVWAILRRNRKSACLEQSVEGDFIRIRLAQELFFLHKAAIKLTLDQLPENSRVWIDASQTSYIDYDVLELIKEFRQTQSKMKNIELTLKGFRDKYLLEESDFVRVEHKNQ